MKAMGIGRVTALALTLGISSASGQGRGKEHDLSWKLPHDRAAIYEVFDSRSRKSQGHFLWLGYELASRVGAAQTSDLPFRYLFRSMPRDIAVGKSWEVKESVFAEFGGYEGVSPLDAAGYYRLVRVRKAGLDKLLPSAFRGKKEKPSVEELAIVEGRIGFHRALWSSGKRMPAEKRPSATLTVMVVIRVSDGVIVGGRYQWSGRTENYDGKITTPKVGRGVVGNEVVLREVGVKLTKETLAEKIQPAIDRGVAWLKSVQQPNGAFSDKGGYPVGTTGGLGSTGLAVVALLHSGVKPDDAAIEKAFRHLRKSTQEPYDLALKILAIEAKYLPFGVLKDVESFSEEKARQEIAQKITEEEKREVESAVKGLLLSQHASGGFGYMKGLAADFSHMQYTVLALRAASRVGVKIPLSVWRRALQYTLNTGLASAGVDLRITKHDDVEVIQSVPGMGWKYTDKYPAATSTMTAAAVATIAICSSELTRGNALSDGEARSAASAALSGLGYLQHFYGLRAATPEGCTHRAAMLYYYLYAFERAMILWDIREIGEHDWYWEGVALLASWQHEDGMWSGPHGSSVIDTAWALLFLKRATVPIETKNRPKIATGDNR